MSYINHPFSVAPGTPLVIPLNRWAYPDYTLQLTSSTAGTMLVEGTLEYVNRGETPVFSTLKEADNTTVLSAVADPAILKIQELPLEAIRLTATTATITGRLMQTGAI